MALYKILINDRLTKLVEDEHAATGLGITEIVAKALSARYRPTVTRRTKKPIPVTLPDVPVHVHDRFSVAYSYPRQKWLLYQVRQDTPAVIAEYLLKGDATEAARQLRLREAEMDDALWQLRKEKIV